MEVQEGSGLICTLRSLLSETTTGEKAIGTGWMVAPPEEEESNWGGTTLTM